MLPSQRGALRRTSSDARPLDRGRRRDVTPDDDRGVPPLRRIGRRRRRQVDQQQRDVNDEGGREREP